MRGYSWGNMYLSSIQQGIQGWHAQNEIFCKYKLNSPEVQTFLKWCKRHKTLMLLNGGYAEHVEEVARVLTALSRHLKKSSSAQKEVGVKALPVVTFREEKAALNESTTAAFTVLPATCYCTSARERKALLKRADDLGYDDPLDAADRGGRHFSITERFKLVALSGNLAH